MYVGHGLLVPSGLGCLGGPKNKPNPQLIVAVATAEQAKHREKISCIVVYE